MYEHHWEFIIEHRAMLYGLCKAMSRGRDDMIDELWSNVVVDRIEAVCATYNSEHGSGASLKHHVQTNMRLYMWKYMNKTTRNETVALAAADEPSIEFPDDLETNDQVSNILEQLDEHDRYVLLLYHKEQLTFGEIAELLGSNCKGTGRHHYISALKRAKAIADDMA